MTLVINHRPISKYEQAANELLTGIPGLAGMSLADGSAAIDRFVEGDNLVEGWQSPSLSFNPWRYFTLLKHEQRVAQTVNGW